MNAAKLLVEGAVVGFELEAQPPYAIVELRGGFEGKPMQWDVELEVLDSFERLMLGDLFNLILDKDDRICLVSKGVISN